MLSKSMFWSLLLLHTDLNTSKQKSSNNSLYLNLKLLWYKWLTMKFIKNPRLLNLIKNKATDPPPRRKSMNMLRILIINQSKKQLKLLAKGLFIKCHLTLPSIMMNRNQNHMRNLSTKKILTLLKKFKIKLNSLRKNIKMKPLRKPIPKRNIMKNQFMIKTKKRRRLKTLKITLMKMSQ